MNSKVGANKECVHIFSGGRSVDSTFSQAIKRYRIDHVVILKGKPGDSDKDKSEDEAIEKSIRALRDYSDKLAVSVSTIVVNEDNVDNIRDEILELQKNHPLSQFFFNITGGKKVLSLNLFTMAVWMDATPYYVDINGNISEFSIPRIHPDNLDPEGPYFSILSLMYSLSNEGKDSVLYSDVFLKLSESYRPTVQRTKGRYPHLRRGTFSKLIRYLIERGLLEEDYVGFNHRSKELKITRDGVFTFNFINGHKIKTPQ